MSEVLGIAIDPEQPLMEAGLDSIGEEPHVHHYMQARAVNMFKAI